MTDNGLAPNQHAVADLLKWQRDGLLDLNPDFQRRSSWKTGAKSYLLDTVIKGLPVPLVFLRARIDVHSFDITREVVDGQQRLRSLLGFVDPGCLTDFDPERDRFTLSRAHNPELAGRGFSELPAAIRAKILGYKFSVITLPPEMEDRDVLQIFARLNSTGLKLNDQELRNAKFFGEFKTAMYDLSYQQLERWQGWKIFSGDELARMKEVELTSDLVNNMISGLSAKTKGQLDSLYGARDESFPEGREVVKRFRAVMDALDEVYGERMASSVFNREMHFWTLFVYLYDRMYGLGSELASTKPRPASPHLAKRLDVVSARYKDGQLPIAVEKAISGAATDIGRRRTRLTFLQQVCG